MKKGNLKEIAVTFMGAIVGKMIYDKVIKKEEAPETENEGFAEMDEVLGEEVTE